MSSNTANADINIALTNAAKFDSGTFGNRENLDGISIGAFEMAQFCAGYHADKNPSITVLELPFLGVSSLEQALALIRPTLPPPGSAVVVGISGGVDSAVTALLLVDTNANF